LPSTGGVDVGRPGRGADFRDEVKVIGKPSKGDEATNEVKLTVVKK
jgi:hypothetical protein